MYIISQPINQIVKHFHCFNYSIIILFKQTIELYSLVVCKRTARLLFNMHGRGNNDRVQREQ